MDPSEPRAGPRHQPVRLGWPLVLLLAAAAWRGRLVDALLLLILLLSHEAAHLAVAAGLGCRITGLRLMPLGGVLTLGPEVGAVPAIEAAVAAAGPLHHIILLSLAALAAPFPRSLGTHWPFFARANLSLALFNLLPIYPLDGGRLLRAALVRPLGAAGARRLTLRLSRWLAAALAAGGAYLFWRGLGPLPALCGLYLLFASAESPAYSILGHLRIQERKQARLAREHALPLHILAVRREARIWPNLARAASRRYVVFCVLDRAGRAQAWISEEQAVGALTRLGFGVRFAALVPGKSRAGVGLGLSNEIASGNWICREDARDNSRDR